jgi:hypothetical protein
MASSIRTVMQAFLIAGDTVAGCEINASDQGQLETFLQIISELVLNSALELLNH